MTVIMAVVAASKPAHTDFKMVIAMGTAEGNTKDGKMTQGTSMCEPWRKPLTVISHGWALSTIFRTGIEMAIVADSAGDTKPQIEGGEIAIMMTTTGSRLALFCEVRWCRLTNVRDC